MLIVHRYCKICGEELGEKVHARRQYHAECYKKQDAMRNFNKRGKRVEGKPIDFRGTRQEYINQHKTNAGCCICGVNEPAYILDLHHLDPSTKEISFSDTPSWKAVMDELPKCVVLCAIHHRMVEAGDLLLTDTHARDADRR